MNITQLILRGGEWMPVRPSGNIDHPKAGLVLCFGSPALVSDPTVFEQLRSYFPAAHIALCSTAGEIIDREVEDDTVVATAIEFEKTALHCVQTSIHDHENSCEAGKYLISQFTCPELAYIMVLSDGANVNGTELVQGLNEANTRKAIFTGGLAGDGPRFQKTFVGLNQPATEGKIVAIGLVGDAIRIGHGSVGGWDEFGPERTITRSDKNLLYEIDNKNALDLYKEYLGPYKDELPGSALLFPLALREPGSEHVMVRTILSIDEENKTMTFAGNIPVGSTVRLMKANFDKLINASSAAAIKVQDDAPPELAILISCVGRKLILQERISEEVEVAVEQLGGNPVVCGFYSYGEISPLKNTIKCELYNQTMTITTISER